MRSVLIIIIAVLLFSCSSHSRKANYKLIPEEKFIKILVQYHLAEAITNSENFREAYKKIDKISLTDTVIVQNGYTRADFDSTISFYSAKPAEFDELYEKVITELSRLEADAETDMHKKNKTNKPK